MLIRSILILLVVGALGGFVSLAVVLFPYIIAILVILSIILSIFQWIKEQFFLKYYPQHEMQSL